MRVRRKRVFGEVCSFSSVMESIDEVGVDERHLGVSCTVAMSEEVATMEVSALSEPGTMEVSALSEPGTKMLEPGTKMEGCALSEAVVTAERRISVVEVEQAPKDVVDYIHDAIAHVEGKALEDILSVDDFDLDLDVDMLQFAGLPDLPDPIVYGSYIPPDDVGVPKGPELMNRESSLSIPGMRDFPDVGLVEAGKGNAKSKSAHNDRWSMKRAEQLREGLGWDTTIPLGDLPLCQLDDLLSNLFSRVVKMKGGLYPSSTLKNMMNGFNRVIRHASDVRSLKGMTNIVGRDFDIKTHPAFARTRLTIDQAIKKSAAEGANKKTTKVETLTLAMEFAILADIEHQITVNTGCQKRLALYLMCRLGIRGGSELHQLLRMDLQLCVDKRGREYIKFEERHSKNNVHNVNRTEEHQFRKTYHSYEPDFILTLKQYLRHMPELVEGMKADLFMQAIKNPATNVWYNKVHKVSIDASTGWLKNMVKLVNIPDSVITNKSGRVTLITRMAALGVPDEVGMMISGHHTQDGYSRYDRTQKLKMEAGVFVSCNPGVSYESALQEVSKRFVEEDIVGDSSSMRPLLAVDTASSSTMGSTDTLPPLTIANQDLTMVVASSPGVTATFQNALVQNPFHSAGGAGGRQVEFNGGTAGGQLQLQSGPVAAQFRAKLPVLRGKGHATMMPTIQAPIPGQIEDATGKDSGSVRISDISQQNQLAEYHADYDGINWDLELARNAQLARHFRASINNQCSMQGANFKNCNITIKIVGEDKDDDKDKENKIPKLR